MRLSDNLSDVWQKALQDKNSRYHPAISRLYKKKQEGRLAEMLGRWNPDGLAIFGLGHLGLIVTLELLSAGVKPCNIIENRPEMNGGIYMDIPVIESRLVWSNPEIKTVFITAIFDFQTISDNLNYYNNCLDIQNLDTVL